uniref:hypothetical protein n=1 Tax=Anaerobutyricum hallii TaxID=39488 RepID=UPI003FEFC42B
FKHNIIYLSNLPLALIIHTILKLLFQFQKIDSEFYSSVKDSLLEIKDSIFVALQRAGVLKD